MHTPTHAIPTHPQTPGRASVLMERAQTIRGLPRCHRLFRWLLSLPARLQGEPPGRCNGGWDPQREMIQGPPTGGALDVYAAWGEVSRITLYTFLP